MSAVAGAQIEVHDAEVLARTRRLLDGCNDFESMGAEILAAAQREAIQERRKKNGAAHPIYWAGLSLTGRD